jgi:type VI secretion system protein ImpE
LREGRLSEAIQAQVQVVKARPTEPDERFLLFVMLCFAGNFERADIHLQALIAAEGAKRGDASIYQALLSAEYERQTVFTKAGVPTVTHDAAGVEHRVSALEALRRNDRASAIVAIDRANEQAVESSGKLDGKPFDSLCDYDDLLGNVLEVYAGGRYLWIPFEEIRLITISLPVHQLDLLWTPTEIVRADGETSYVHLPALYPGTAAAEDEGLRLGRSTEWVELGGNLNRGVGQRVLFATLGDEVIEAPLLETRVIEFAASEATAAG